MINSTSAATFVALFLASRLSGTAQTLQYVTLNAIDNSHPVNFYPVQTNQVISVVGYDWIDKPQISGLTVGGNLIPLNPYSILNSSTYSASASIVTQVVTGLTNIQVGSVGWVTFQVATPGCSTIVSNYIPADAVVIPSSATGNVEIILESSSDLVNWSAANPGIYGASSATNRFFRVRAVIQ